MCAIPSMSCTCWPCTADKVTTGLHTHSYTLLQEAVARTVFQQMLDGLDYCHRRGIYHRCGHTCSRVDGADCLAHSHTCAMC